MSGILIPQASNRSGAPKPDRVDLILKGAAEKSARYLEAVVDGSEPGTNRRSEAARTILDRAGYGAQSRPAAPQAKQIKDLSDMTAGELRETLEAIRVQLSNRATVIDGEVTQPSDAPADDQLTELLG